MNKMFVAAAIFSSLLFVNCASSIPACDESIDLHRQARNAIGEERESLEARARAQETLCAQGREKSWQESQNDRVRNPRR